MTATTKEIRKLATHDDFVNSYPLIKQLRSPLSLDEYLSLLGEMTQTGYQLYGLFVSGKLVALAGIGIHINLYNKKHLFIYELVTDEFQRSKGYGAYLLQYIEQVAKDNECERIELTSGIKRSDAHRFYEDKIGMQRTSYVYRKNI